MAKEDRLKNLIPAKKGEIRNPKGRGKGALNTRTILKNFLNIEMKQKNPFTKKEEQMTVLELMNLKQIANALEGDLNAYKEIINRYEGLLTTKTDITSDGNAILTPPTIVFKKPDDSE